MTLNYRWWTEPEIDLLGDTSATIKDISKRIDRTYEACCKKAQVLGIRRETHSPRYQVWWYKKPQVFQAKVVFGDLSLGKALELLGEYARYKPTLVRSKGDYFVVQIKRQEMVAQFCHDRGWIDRQSQQGNMDRVREVLRQNFSTILNYHYLL